MKIPVVYALDSYGCSPTYTVKALERMGHETKRMSHEDYFIADPNDYDLFFCQDSGEGIDFRRASSDHIRKTSMWYWDSRWNRLQRDPGDDDMARRIIEAGGWVFQAQTPDLERIKSMGMGRCSWLPIAGDTIIWSDEPAEDKLYDLSFIGNCRDQGRAVAIEKAREFNLYWPGPNSVFFEEAAKIYRQSKVVFHAPTFYNLPHDFIKERVDWDTTMRCYEANACGVPVVTPPMPDYDALGFEDGKHVFIYNSLGEIPGAIRRALSANVDPKGLHEFISSNHTYEHRLETAFSVLRNEGVLQSG